MIERQIEAMQQGAETLPLTSGSPPPLTPELRVQTLEQELATARTNYTDKRPEVLRIQEELRSARSAAAAERSRPAEDRLPHLKNDPTYRQLLADRENGRLRVRELQRAESQARAQIGFVSGPGRVGADGRAASRSRFRTSPRCCGRTSARSSTTPTWW